MMRKRSLALVFLIALSACAPQWKTPPSDETASPAARDAKPSSDRVEQLLAVANIGANASDADRRQAEAALLELGQLYSGRGDFEAAYDSYARALGVRRGHSQADATATLDIELRLAAALSNQRRFIEAAQALDVLETRIRSDGDALIQARFHAYRAFHGFLRGELDDAEREAAEARRLRSQFIDDAEAGGATGTAAFSQLAEVAGGAAELAHSYIIEAAVALRREDYDDALNRAERARLTLDRTGATPEWWLPLIIEMEAMAEAGLGRTPKAIEKLDAARDLWAALNGENGRAVAISDLRRGRVLLDDGAIEDALFVTRRAIETLSEPDARGFGLGYDALSPYFDVLLKDDDRRDALANEAVRVLQLVREGVAARVVSRATARLAEGDDQLGAILRAAQAAARKRDQLNAELGRALLEKPGATRDIRIAKLRSAIEQQTTSIDVFDAKLAREYPNYDRLLASSLTGGEEIAALLAPDEAVVAFGVGRTNGVVTLVRKDRTVIAPLAFGRRDFGEAINALRQAFEIESGRIGVFNMQAAHALYQALLGPVEQALGGVNHLIVAPSGPLAALPFPLLIASPPPSGERYASADWLIGRMAISATPSLQTFVSLRRSPDASQAPRPMLGVGAPAFLGSDAGIDDLALHCRADGPMPPSLIQSLEPLPRTADEVRAVAETLGGQNTILSGGAATETALRSKSLSQYQILYFATHGFLPGELRCQSEPGLALSTPSQPATDRSTDGFLDASEVAQLSLDADLVVLSACNTAGTEDALGGGALAGLASAFFHAGARGLIATHWQIESAVSAELMSNAFRNARAAGGLAHGLAAEQRRLAAVPATAHPFYWAPIAMIGDGRRRFAFLN